MASTEAKLVDQCRGVLKVYSDGSIWRSNQPSFPHPYEDDGRVLWKDVIFDPVLGLELRLYIPAAAEAGSSLLPIFVYFHGGGYCIGSRTWGNFHNYCLRLSLALNAVLVAPDYRVGPENRLPASLDDGFNAIRWIRAQAESPTDPWLAQRADFGRVYVSGDSAGGGIAYHVSMRSPSESWGRMKIKGYVLLMPFFGGEKHTPSEATCPPDAFLNLELNDKYWKLSLPMGTNRDHPFSNPFGPGAPSLADVELPPVLVVGGGCDLLRDRGIEYADKLKEYGKQVFLAMYEGQQHGFFTLTPHSEASRDLMDRILTFIQSHP
uniref:Alpha/beta hydrolase fold-3 domain-containing protein n=1 Tax=Araucaria cunninghamii TaxID=56994 RepID=A0A0D6R074_ARACU